MASNYQPRFEHCIYIPVPKYLPGMAAAVASECGGCTVIYSTGGTWYDEFGNVADEPVNIIKAITSGGNPPGTFDRISADLLAGGEQAVLITRQPIDVTGI